MTTKVSARKLDGMYEALMPLERARLLARFWRDKNPAELDRLRSAIPDERAGRAYNEALAILRGINSGFVVRGIESLINGFERDGFAVFTVNWRGYQQDTAHDTLSALIDLIAYPVTESEYAAIVKRERTTLRHVGDWSDLIWGEDGIRPELQAIMAEFYEPYTYGEMSEEEREAWLERYTARVIEEVRAAIARGELPKPRKAPKDATNAEPGDLWLPDGALSDWAKGTTEATYPIHAMDAAPVLEFFLGSFMRCEVFPDSELERVKAGRAKMREALTRIARIELDVPKETLEGLSFEPVLSERERSKRSDLVAGLWAASDASDDRLKSRQALRFLLTTFAARKAELRALTDIIETFQRETFGGEDPFDPRGREMLERAWEAMRHTEASLSSYPRLPPIAGDTEPWPPAFDEEASYTEVRSQYEEYIRRGGE